MLSKICHFQLGVALSLSKTDSQDMLPITWTHVIDLIFFARHGWEHIGKL